MTLDRRYAVLIGGPPGTGKSTLAASIADVVGNDRTLVLCAKPNESNSWGYTSRNLMTEVYFDAKWRPSLNSYEADGFMRLMYRLFNLMEDTQYDAVILDPLTDAAELVYHELLKKDNAATPRDTRDSQAYYGAVRAKMNELIKAITQLQFAERPKHVIVTTHLQPVREETRTQVKSQDKKAQGIVFEGGALPSFEGSYKYVVAGDFDIVVYTDVQTKMERAATGFKSSTHYVIQVTPDNDRHAKQRLGPALTENTLPNNFSALFAAMNGKTS